MWYMIQESLKNLTHFPWSWGIWDTFFSLEILECRMLTWIAYNGTKTRVLMQRQGALLSLDYSRICASSPSKVMNGSSLKMFRLRGFEVIANNRSKNVRTIRAGGTSWENKAMPQILTSINFSLGLLNNLCL